jgi:hypothetical protein
MQNPLIRKLKENQRSNESSKKRLLLKNGLKPEIIQQPRQSSAHISKQHTPTNQQMSGIKIPVSNTLKQQTTQVALSGMQDSFMNESLDIDTSNKHVTPQVSQPEISMNASQTTKDKSNGNSQPVTHRRREIKEKSQETTRNMFSFKAVDNMVYTDLLSEGTIMSPNYKPPRNPEERKKICFNSPHNLNGQIKKFVFPGTDQNNQSQQIQPQQKLQMSQNAPLSFIQRYKASRQKSNDAYQP